MVQVVMDMEHTGRCPLYLGDVLRLVSSSSGRSCLKSATTAQWVKPKLRTVFGERAFLFAGPKAWNDLPSRFHNVTSTASFKRQLKTCVQSNLTIILTVHLILFLYGVTFFYCVWTFSYN